MAQSQETLRSGDKLSSADYEFLLSAYGTYSKTDDFKELKKIDEGQYKRIENELNKISEYYTKLLNKIKTLIFLVSVLLIGCQSDENQDEKEIINLVQSTLIKPILYPNFIEKNKIYLSQKDYDKANVILLIEPEPLDSVWYSKVLANNKFTYVLSDTLFQPQFKNDNYVKIMAKVNGIDLNKSSHKLRKINFGDIKTRNNIIRIDNKNKNPKGFIYIGKFNVSQIYFDNKRVNAYTEIMGIRKNNSGITKKDTTRLPVLLKKENGKWKIKNL